MDYIFFDAETYYDDDYSLKKMTPVEYILDQRFELLGAAFIEGLNGTPFWLEPEDAPRYLHGLGPKTLVVSHNMLFDGCILSYRCGYVPPMMACTLAMTRAVAKQKLGLLPSLDRTAKFLGLPPKLGTIKKMVGVHLKDLRADPQLHAEFKAYGCHDNWLCQQIFKTWCINTARFPIGEIPILDNVLRTAVVPSFMLDIPVLQQHLLDVRKRKSDLMLTAGVSDKAELMSNPKFADLLRRFGVEPPTKISPTTHKLTYAFSKQDLDFLALETHPDPDIQALYAARVGNKTTLEETRTERMLTIGALEYPNGAKGWMPMPLRYSAARTHRLGGEWQLNVQNLPRTSPMRAALVAPPGYVVVAGDSSQIEARLTATISGALSLVTQFATGEDVYASFGSLVFGYPVNKKDHPTQRFVGKQAVLGLGFGLGALNFVRRIQIDSKNQTGNMIVLKIEEGQHVVNLYRRTYKEIPDAWDQLGSVGIQCLVHGGPWRFGPVIFDKSRIMLPSGLPLYYHDMQWDGAEWTYDTGYEGRKKIYGPKLMENIIQSLARIITMDASVRIRKHIGPFALQSHDELVYIIPEAKADEARKIIHAELLVRPNWMLNAPLAAEVKIGANYAEAK